MQARPVHARGSSGDEGAAWEGAGTRRRDSSPPGERSATGRTRERPRRRPRRRTAAALSPPPFSSLLPPSRGEVGRGVRRRRAGASGWAAGVRRRSGAPPSGLRSLGHPPFRPSPFQGEERGREDAPTPPDAGPGGGPPPPSLLSPFSSLLPPFRGEVGRGVRRRRAGASGRAAGVRRRSGAPRPVCGARVIPPSDLPPSRGRSAAGRTRQRPRRWTGRRTAAALSPPPSLLSSPLQGGGREGGPLCRRAGGAVGHPPRPPFQGGGGRTGRPGPARRTGGPFIRLPATGQ